MAEKLKFGLISMGSKSSLMILEEASKIFPIVKHIDIRKIEIRMDKKIQILYDGEPLEHFDCIYMRGSYKYSKLLYGLSEVLKNKCFLPLDAMAHLYAHNKFMTQLHFLSDSTIKMPAAYFTGKISETKSFLKNLNYPVILKFPEGTHGKGVIFAESYASASSMADALEIFDQPVLVQDYVEIKSDLRVIVAGTKVIASMRRIAKKGEVRANAHLGADAEPYVVSAEVKKMCIDAAKKINALVCAVDVIESPYGPMILEVNTSPGLQKITEVTKKNIAKEIATYLFDETNKFIADKGKLQTKNVMDNLGVSEIGTRDIEIELVVKNGKIVLPEFAYNMSGLREGQHVTLRVAKGKVEILRD